MPGPRRHPPARLFRLLGRAPLRMVVIGLAIALATGPKAHAQVLHEPVRVSSAAAQPGPPTPEPGEQIFSPQPEAPVEAGGESAESAPGDHPPDRRDLIRADRNTGPEPPGAHDYHVVFDPAPFPYKRMTALDSVRITPCLDGRKACDDEVLEVADRTLWPVRVYGPEDDPAREQFRGSIVIDFEPGRWVPIPSVAADIRVLSAQTNPPIAVEFARDGADNYFVRSPSGGRHRLTWLSSAPSTYFGGALPGGVRLADEPRELRRQVPARLRRRVDRVLARAGVRLHRGATLASVLDPLVSYFRAFQLGTLPPPTGSSYCDLALGQKGCCRHRSYAFAITAMAVGIPVRYLENEVHVFVEVYVPKMGWRRINLGGAPLDEQLLGAEGKSLHHPKGGDPFPAPAPFLAAAAPPPKGMEALAQKSESVSDSEALSSSPGEHERGAAGGEANGAAGESGSSTNGPPRVDLTALAAADRAGASVSARTASAPRRAPTEITVTLGASSSFRGDRVEVSGQVRSQGGGAAGLEVEIYLALPGHLDRAVQVAEVVTDAAGRYRASVEVPVDLPLGANQVIARTRGDARHAPSITR